MIKSKAAVLLVALGALSACTSVMLTNPEVYRKVPADERLGIRCYYALDPATESLVASSWGYRVPMGPALSEQLRSALNGLCRGAFHVEGREEYQDLAGDKPGVMILVRATAELSVGWFPFAGSSGAVRGDAEVTGLAETSPLHYDFSAKRVKYPDFGDAQMGAEGLRNALRDVVQQLVDEIRADREEVERLADKNG